MSKCSICLENNINLLMSCTHGLCHQCVTDLQSGNCLDSCPICRKKINITYKTFFPNTKDHYPNKITNWNYENKKSMTQTEKIWIERNWGKIKDVIDKNIMINNNKYIISYNNLYFFGNYLNRNRDNQNEYIFGDCIVLDKRGQYYKCSPPTRSLDLTNKVIYDISKIIGA